MGARCSRPTRKVETGARGLVQVETRGGGRSMPARKVAPAPGPATGTTTWTTDVKQSSHGADTAASGSASSAADYQAPPDPPNGSWGQCRVSVEAAATRRLRARGAHASAVNARSLTQSHFNGEPRPRASYECTINHTKP